jgi:O-antigen/teichoic acid export membrane protein
MGIKDRGKKNIEKLGKFLLQIIVIFLIIFYVLPWSLRTIPKSYDKIILLVSLVILVFLIILIVSIINAQKRGCSKGWIKKFLEWDKKLEKRT